MSWIGQIALGAYLVFILGTVAMLFATILLAAGEFPSPGKGGAGLIPSVARPEDLEHSPPVSRSQSRGPGLCSSGRYFTRDDSIGAPSSRTRRP
jgi:hypothetical protein